MSVDAFFNYNDDDDYLNNRPNNFVAFQSTVLLYYECALKTFHELATRFHDLSE